MSESIPPKSDSSVAPATTAAAPVAAIIAVASTGSAKPTSWADEVEADVSEGTIQCIEGEKVLQDTTADTRIRPIQRGGGCGGDSSRRGGGGSSRFQKPSLRTSSSGIGNSGVQILKNRSQVIRPSTKSAFSPMTAANEVSSLRPGMSLNLVPHYENAASAATAVEAQQRQSGGRRMGTRARIPISADEILQCSIKDILQFVVALNQGLILHPAPVFRDAPASFKTAIRSAHDATFELMTSYNDQWTDSRSRSFQHGSSSTMSFPIQEIAEQGPRGPRGRGSSGRQQFRRGRGSSAAAGGRGGDFNGNSDPAIVPLEETGTL